VQRLTGGVETHRHSVSCAPGAVQAALGGDGAMRV
jgi:hypothetical protein